MSQARVETTIDPSIKQQIEAKKWRFNDLILEGYRHRNECADTQKNIDNLVVKIRDLAIKCAWQERRINELKTAEWKSSKTPMILER